jgi:hypothetical protein
MTPDQRNVTIFVSKVTKPVPKKPENRSFDPKTASNGHGTKPA